MIVQRGDFVGAAGYLVDGETAAREVMPLLEGDVEQPDPDDGGLEREVSRRA